MRKSLLAAILFAGCGGSSPQPKTTTAAPSTPTEAATDTAPASTPAATPAAGGVAVVPTPGNPPAPQKGGAPELGSWGFDLKGMNTKVLPGQSFYEYANGTWLSSTPIPEDKSNYGMFSVLADRSDERTKEIILNAK